MSDDFGNDIVTISDETGKEYTLEHFDTVEIDDEMYMAFLPADMDEENDEYGIVILQAVGDDELAVVEDEELEEQIYDLIMQRLFDDSDENMDEED